MRSVLFFFFFFLFGRFAFFIFVLFVCSLFFFVSAGQRDIKGKRTKSLLPLPHRFLFDSLSSRAIPHRVARLFTGNQRARGSLQAKAMTMNEHAFWHGSVTVYSTHNVKWPSMMLATMFYFMSCKPFSFKGNVT